jgi:hypothetical protein
MDADGAVEWSAPSWTGLLVSESFVAGPFSTAALSLLGDGAPPPHEKAKIRT